MPFWLEIVINVVFSYLASAGFALTINVPHRALNFSGISGVVAWMAYWFCFRAGMGRMLSNLLGAFLIGILSLFFARIKKCPVTVFNIPALVPLVPGMPACLHSRRLSSRSRIDLAGSHRYRCNRDWLLAFNDVY